MAITVTMPRLSDTMEEGTLIKWHVQVGDDVSAGDHLADVETDKATMELQAFDDGKVARLAVEEGDTVPVGEMILVLAEEGESVDDAAKAEPAAGGGEGAAEQKGRAAKPAEGEEAEEAEEAEEEGEADKEAGDKGAQTQEAAASGQAAVAEDADVQRTQKQAGAPSAGRIRVSPLARKLAEEHGLDLAAIDGSGPDGRIIKRDVLQAVDQQKAGKPTPTTTGAPPEAKKAAPAPAPAVGGATLESRSISLSGMRKTIAKRLVESKTTIPHFTVSMGIDMDPLMSLRKTLNAQLESQGVKLSVNDFITRAAALACVQHPLVNASWNGDTIEVAGTVNVGIAVALPEERGGGLVVPVLRDVQNQGLRTISEQTKQLAKKARETGLSADEMGGGTFTISNLGMYGVEHFEAIINPPQAAILAVGGAIEKPVVRDGQIVVGHEMTATLSADHRVIDGAIAAEYLQTLKQMLENPAGLLV